MNSPDLLHLQTDMQGKLIFLESLKRTSWFKSETETQKMLKALRDYECILTDYSRSLLLDISCCEAEISFSICKPFEETESRLTDQKQHVRFLSGCSDEFGKILNKKISELIKSRWFVSEEKIKDQKRDVEKKWEETEDMISDLKKQCEKRLQSIEKILNRKNNIFYLQVKNQKKAS